MLESEERPWVSWHVLDVGPGYKVKCIHVRPGGRLSRAWPALRALVVIAGVPTAWSAVRRRWPTPAAPLTYLSAPSTGSPNEHTSELSSSRSSAATRPVRTTSLAWRTTTARCDRRLKCPASPEGCRSRTTLVLGLSDVGRHREAKLQPVDIGRSVLVRFDAPTPIRANVSRLRSAL